MSISVPSEPIYRPCYKIDLESRKMTPGQYNYTEMLQKAKASAPPEGVTYWEPDEYGRVFIDPNHPMHATIESSGAADYSNIQLPASPSCSLPSGGGTKERTEKEDERKLQEERLRMFREERERIAQQEAIVRRLYTAIMSARR